MMLWKCCTQYASKFGKLSSCHRTRKCQFSFQSQRKAMPRNVQITIQLHSFHMPTKLCPKSLKTGFHGRWAKNFQMYKLDLEKTEEPGIKLSTSAAAAAAKPLQSCLTLYDSTDGSLPGSSIHGIFQPTVLEWVATAFSTTSTGSSKKQESS